MVKLNNEPLDIIREHIFAKMHWEWIVTFKNSSSSSFKVCIPFQCYQICYVCKIVLHTISKMGQLVLGRACENTKTRTSNKSRWVGPAMYHSCISSKKYPQSVINEWKSQTCFRGHFVSIIITISNLTKHCLNHDMMML